MEEEENENDEKDAVLMAGSVDWREREVDIIDRDAGGVSTEGSSVGAVS